ncbi:hypothetical protein V5O48_006916 [Marasmius crinis-equi]|uniref:Uncharacterized protein n=1 Tax=Marasmius crinis-equi TaxID=585013 RepID=A0ABR3FIC4_9AGAR
MSSYTAQDAYGMPSGASRMGRPNVTDGDQLAGRGPREGDDHYFDGQDEHFRLPSSPSDDGHSDFVHQPRSHLGNQQRPVPSELQEHPSDETSATPFALAADLAGVLGLDEQHRKMLLAFLGAIKDVPVPLLKGLIVIHANQLQQDMKLEELKRQVESHTEIMNETKSKLQDNPNVGGDQKKEILSQAKMAVFEPDRVDFDNDALLVSVKARLEKSKLLNGFEELFKDSTSQTKKHAFNSEIRTQLVSSAKTTLRDLIKKSIHPESGSCVSATVTAAARKLTGSSDGLNAKHGIRIVLMRQYARNNPKLLEPKRGATAAAAIRAAKRKRPDNAAENGGSEATEEPEQDHDEMPFVNSFGAWMNGMYQNQKYGSNYANNDWPSAIQEERKLWPNDTIPLIPARMRDAPSSAPANIMLAQAGSGGSAYSSMMTLAPSSIQGKAFIFVEARLQSRWLEQPNRRRISTLF